jgi:hypothetical protein
VTHSVSVIGLEAESASSASCQVKNGKSVDSTGTGTSENGRRYGRSFRNERLEATNEDMTLKIRLGNHMKKVREGMENGAHP